MKSILLPIFLIFSTFNINFDWVSVLFQDDQNEIPNVFMIGEFESDYEQIISGCDNLLLTVCNESMDDAYKNWLLMLNDVEKYAEEVNFDIKGVKVWLNVFWNADGSIQHIVYYPKPSSRNMDFSLLSDFLNSFVTNYESPIKFNECFSHYGSGTFPTFASYYLKESKSDQK